MTTDGRSPTDPAAPTELHGREAGVLSAQPQPRRVGVRMASLLAEPGGRRERELVFGDRLDVIEMRDGWSFGRAGRDGYRGWVASHDLRDNFTPTHRVILRQTHLYPAPDFKQPPVMRLHFSASVAVRAQSGRWAETPDGFVRADHLRSVDAPMTDPVAVATLFLGTPYLWAGNTGDGIDCSGLVQAACLACGIACPADSEQQEAVLGTALAEGAPLQRADLLFWKGHVAWVADPDTILHANVGAMAVAYEPLAAAIERIAAQGDGPVTSRRRL